ncbi:MAG: hypothetical protein V4594_08080 [Bacteroidota bacterium]
MRSLIIYTAVAALLTLGFSCSKNSAQNDAFAGGGSTGIGGSMARFTITNDHLYTVSDTKLSVFDISTASNPVQKNTLDIGWGVETIFPMHNNLFIGTQTGMKIMDVSNPIDPTKISEYQHIRSCDPVVANDQYAYVTLRTDNMCTRGTNELQIIDISDLKKPVMVKSYSMGKPQGLALEGNNLFVCDNIIKWYDITDPKALILKNTSTIEGTDLIAHNGILMVIGPGGLSQYTYNTGELKLLSRIPSSL